MEDKSKIIIIASIVLILIGLIFIITLKSDKVDESLRTTKTMTTTSNLDVTESDLGYEIEYDKDIIKLSSTQSKDRYSLIDDEKIYFELSVVPMTNCTKDEENYIKGESKCLKLYSSCDTNEVNCMKLHDILDSIKVK